MLRVEEMNIGNEIEDLYMNEKISSDIIANKYNISPSSVQNYLRKKKILRTNSESAKIRANKLSHLINWKKANPELAKKALENATKAAAIVNSNNGEKQLERVLKWRRENPEKYNKVVEKRSYKVLGTIAKNKKIICEKPFSHYHKSRLEKECCGILFNWAKEKEKLLIFPNLLFNGKEFDFVISNGGVLKYVIEFHPKVFDNRTEEKYLKERSENFTDTNIEVKMFRTIDDLKDWLRVCIA